MKLHRYARAAVLSAAITVMYPAGYAAAAVERERVPETDPLAGNWKDDRGGLAVLVAQGGVLDMFGTDTASIYRAICVRDTRAGRTATCTGEGVNHANGFRFAYRSQLQLGEAGTLTEEWEAQGPNVRLKGKAVFKRAAATPAR